MEDICEYQARYPVLPVPRSLHRIIFTVSPICSSSGPGSHWMDQPSTWTACDRIVSSTTLTFVQHLFSLHIYFLGYWCCHPPPGNLPQPLGLPWSCSSSSYHGWPCPSCQAPSHWGPSLSVCTQTQDLPFSENTTLKDTLWFPSFFKFVEMTCYTHGVICKWYFHHNQLMEGPFNWLIYMLHFL